MSRVTKKDFSGEIQTVAVAYNQMYDGMDADIAKNVQAIAFDSRNEALQAVKDGTADACYVYTDMAEKFVNQDPDGELIFHIVNTSASDLSIAIRPTTDHALISILSKCMEADQSLFMDELVEKYTYYVQLDVTLAMFVRNNPWFLIALTAVVLGIGTVIMVILGSNRRMRKVAEERAGLAASLKEKNRLLEESVQQAESANIAKTTCAGFQGEHNMEISKQDWALYRRKMPVWQEHYMEHLCKEYAEILSSDDRGSDRFWKLWERIKEDRKCTGVMAQISRSSVIMNLVSLIGEGAITLDDLAEFSEELQERVRFLVER